MNQASHHTCSLSLPFIRITPANSTLNTEVLYRRARHSYPSLPELIFSRPPQSFGETAKRLAIIYPATRFFQTATATEDLPAGARQRSVVSTPRDISKRISDIIFPVYFCNVPWGDGWRRKGGHERESGDAGRLDFSRLGGFIGNVFPRFRLHNTCSLPA